MTCNGEGYAVIHILGGAYVGRALHVPDTVISVTVS